MFMFMDGFVVVATFGALAGIRTLMMMMMMMVVEVKAYLNVITRN